MKKLFTLMLMSICMVLTANAEDTYVVAGSGILLGSTWDGTDESNQMTSTDGVNYTLVKENVTLEAGEYGFKVVKNGSDWIPDGTGNDIILSITETGIYNVTFTYVVGENAPTAKAEKTGNATATDHTYSVIGSFIDNWETDFDMTESPEGTWTAEITGLAAKEYEFKVRTDKNWDLSSYPSNNYKYTVNEDNTTLTIVFDESTKDITVSQSVPTSIDRVNAEADNAPAYNLAGVKASKGLVIKNNKKYILR